MSDDDNDCDGDRRNMLLTWAAGAAGFSLSQFALAGAVAQSKGNAMQEQKNGAAIRVGTVTEPNFYPRLDYYKPDELGYNQQNYSYMSAKGPVVGLVSSLVCTIDRPAREVWPFLKDFNSFEGPFGIRYTGKDGQLVVWGDLYSSEEHDLGEQTLQYGGSKNTWKSVPSRVIRVIPEHLLVLFETIPADGSSDGMSPGFHVIMLNEHKGMSHVSMMLEHAERLKYKTEQEAVDNSRWGPNQYKYTDSLALWRQFVPKLKSLVYGQHANP